MTENYVNGKGKLVSVGPETTTKMLVFSTRTWTTADPTNNLKIWGLSWQRAGCTHRDLSSTLGTPQPVLPKCWAGDFYRRKMTCTHRASGKLTWKN